MKYPKNIKIVFVVSVVSLVAIFVAPGISSAQTVAANSAIQVQIQALLQELQQLEALVALLQNNSAAQATAPAAPTSSSILTGGFSFTITPLGQSSNRIKSASDALAALSFQGSYSGAIALNQINITFSGAAAAPSLLQTGAVRLLDENNQPLGLVITTSTSGGNDVWSFNLGGAMSADAQGVLSAGAKETWTLVVNDFDLAQASGSNSVNLVASINANSDIQYTDSLSGSATTGLTIPSSVLTPLELNSVVFAQGT